MYNTRLSDMTMQKENQPLTFKKEGPFYNMVSSFFVAACGSVSIFSEKHNKIYGEMDEIGLSGVVTADLSVRPFDISCNVKSGYITIEDFKVHICLMLINSAFEKVKNENDHSDEFEFFRHLRNACSHDNKFYFTNREPSRSAKWRTLQIPIETGERNTWYGKRCIGNIIGISDVLLLLWDIEQKIT